MKRTLKKRMSMVSNNRRNSVLTAVLFYRMYVAMVQRCVYSLSAFVLSIQSVDSQNPLHEHREPTQKNER